MRWSSGSSSSDDESSRSPCLNVTRLFRSICFRLVERALLHILHFLEVAALMNVHFQHDHGCGCCDFVLEEGMVFVLCVFVKKKMLFIHYTAR